VAEQVRMPYQPRRLPQQYHIKAWDTSLLRALEERLALVRTSRRIPGGAKRPSLTPPTAAALCRSDRTPVPPGHILQLHRHALEAGPPFSRKKQRVVPAQSLARVWLESISPPGLKGLNDPAPATSGTRWILLNEPHPPAPRKNAFTSRCRRAVGWSTPGPDIPRNRTWIGVLRGSWETAGRPPPESERGVARQRPRTFPSFLPW
jgi:hypothetical protein